MGWSGSSQASQSGQSSGLSHQGNGYHVYAQCLNSILLQHLSWMSAICNLACPRRLAVLGPPLIGRASFTRGPAIRQLGESRSLHQLDARCPRHLLHRARLAVAVQTLSNSLHRALSLAPQLVCCLYNPRPRFHAHPPSDSPCAQPTASLANHQPSPCQTALCQSHLPVARQPLPLSTRLPPRRSSRACSTAAAMATTTQLMPSPSGLKSMSAFSPYTDSPNSPANFANVFSNRCRSLAALRNALHCEC